MPHPFHSSEYCNESRLSPEYSSAGGKTSKEEIPLIWFLKMIETWVSLCEWWVTHTAPESVKRVKSSAQILVKSYFWRLNAQNALGGSSGHQRTPLLNACQKWSPLMTGATSKCICGVQPPEKWLNHYFRALLITCLEQCGLWMSSFKAQALLPLWRSVNILIETQGYVTKRTASFVNPVLMLKIYWKSGLRAWL